LGEGVYIWLMFLGGTNKNKRYQTEKETVLIGKISKKKKANLKTPVVKIRVSRGKTYDPNKTVKSLKDAEKYFREYMNKNRVEGQEQFLVMYLGRGNQVLGIYPHSIGMMTATMVEIKLIVNVGLQLLAEAAITAHNHPSGNLTPSEGDKNLAAKLKTAFSQFDINLLDNLIITKNQVNSF
jgi:DNA repair protein RadC